MRFHDRLQSALERLSEWDRPDDFVKLNLAYTQAGQAYQSSNTRAFEIFDFSTFYTRACRVPDTHERGPQLLP